MSLKFQDIDRSITSFYDLGIPREVCVGEDGNIEFECVKDGCHEVLCLSLRQAEGAKKIRCPGCRSEYSLDQALVEKLKAFEQLVQAVKNAREILGTTSVGVTVDGRTVKIPYRLLLTRMTTMVGLKIGDQELTFRFRVEPLKEEEIKSIH